jgi:hypothetical protein
MRFAWLRENSPDHVSSEESPTGSLIFNAYNLVWWAPLVLSLIRIIDYRTGLIAFFVVTIIRAAANLYRNNVLTLEQAEVFPLRAP